LPQFFRRLEATATYAAAVWRLEATATERGKIFLSLSIPTAAVRLSDVSTKRTPLRKEQVMKYLCLISAYRVMEQMSPDEAARHYDEYREFTAAIRASGHYVSCNRLLPPAAGVTVRLRQGETLVTDGPFAETKEQLGGYFVIEAVDMNEAIQIAARIPGARFGSVEVRPVAEDMQTVEALGFALEAK
jgi:hypothetical protein